MLTIKQIRENPQYAIDKLAVKGVDAAAPIAGIIELDDRRKEVQLRLDKNLSEQNALA